MHEFESTGPIEHDGPTEISCSLCPATYTRDEIGELDSLTWEQKRNGFEGISTEAPNQVYYRNEEQFIENFTKEHPDSETPKPVEPTTRPIVSEASDITGV